MKSNANTADDDFEHSHSYSRTSNNNDTIGDQSQSQSQSLTTPLVNNETDHSRHRNNPTTVEVNDYSDDSESDAHSAKPLSADAADGGSGADRRRMSYEDAVETIGFGRFHVAIMCLCGFGWWFDAMEMILVSFLIPAMKKEWPEISEWAIGLLGSVVFLGMMFGAIGFSYVSDRFGRKKAYIGTVIVTSAFGTVGAFANSYWLLLLLRFLTGIGLGGNLPIVFSIFSEFIPTRRRGFYLSIFSMFWTFGEMMASGIAWVVMPERAGWPVLGWRWLIGLCSAPMFLLLLFVPWMPESPRYLLVSNRVEEATAIVRNIARINKHPLANDIVLRSARVSPTEKGSVWLLLSKPLVKTTLLLWTLWFCVSLSYNGVTFLLPTFFREMHSIDVYLNVFLGTLAQIPFIIIAAVFCERYGRRKVLFALYISSSLSTLLLLSHRLFGVSNNATVWAMVVFAMFAKGLMNGADALKYTVTPEVYPTSLRTTGMGSSSVMSRIAGSITPVLFTSLHSVGLMDLAVIIYGISFAGAAISSLGLPETLNHNLSDTVDQQMKENFSDTRQHATFSIITDANPNEYAAIATDDDDERKP